VTNKVLSHRQDASVQKAQKSDFQQEPDLNCSAKSGKDVYWAYVNKLAVPLQLESTRTGYATVNAQPDDVAALQAVWKSTKLQNQSPWNKDTKGDVLSVKKTGDSPFRLIWNAEASFTGWTVALIKAMYDCGYMVQAKDGEMHFEPKQKWRATGLSPRNGFNGAEGYDIIVEDNNIPISTI
jgi:hypothetical protein